MRSFTAAALVVLSASSPAFSAPLAARDGATNSDQSGALNLGPIKEVVSIGNDVLNGVQAIKGLFDSREDHELLARGENIKNLLSREEFALLARGTSTAPVPLAPTPSGPTAATVSASNSTPIPSGIPIDPESGAIDIGKIVSTAASFLPLFLKREELELLSRDIPSNLPTDESGALDFNLIKDAVSIGNGVINGVQGIKNLFSREELELLARADVSTLPTDESGAINFGPIISTIAGIASNLFSREDAELLARATPLSTPTAPVATNLPTDESGAINFGPIISTIAGIASNLFSREDAELLARAAPSSAPSTPSSSPLTPVPSKLPLPTDESGALDIGKIVSTAASFLPLFLRREEFARDLPADESGALDLGLIKDAISIGNDVVTGVQGIKNLFSREELELLARADLANLPTDESGALNLGPIISTIAGIASNLFSREEVLQARSTNGIGFKSFASRPRSLNELD